MDTAPVGHTATQCPHRMQSPFTRAVTPSTSRFAPTQSSTQRPHPMQYLSSISTSMHAPLKTETPAKGRFQAFASMHSPRSIYSGRFANPARTLSALARSAASSSSFRSNSTTSSTPFLPRRTGTFM